MSQALLTSYDAVPYESKPIYRSHPDGMATVAAVFGMDPPPVARCRVLELGCAGGGNLVPMALSLPDSAFVGIDLSPRQIEEGQELIETLGLSNIELKAMSLMEVDEDGGAFDYIICHGVYSWVPAEVQDKILEICGRHLSANGVAYISYNTYPGWHMRGMIREMMYYHARRTTEPGERVQQARELLDFLAETIGEDTTYGLLLKEEALLLRQQTDSYLLHEQLEENNHPVYFHQFVERAAAKGLQYLAEAQFSPLDANLRPAVKERFQQWVANLVEWEQYLDFLRSRMFRRTLLCREHVVLDRQPAPAKLLTFHLAALAKPFSPQPDIHGSAVEKFHAPDGASLTTNNPLVKAALVSLFEVWPRAVPFQVLWEKVCARLTQVPEPFPINAERDPLLLAEALLHCYRSNVVELHIHPPAFATAISERPVASPLPRLQAAKGAVRVTNLCHRVVELEEMDRLVLRYLDGSRDQAALLALLVDLAAKDILVLRRNGQPLQEAGPMREHLSQSLDVSLLRLAASALLIA